MGTPITWIFTDFELDAHIFQTWSLDGFTANGCPTFFPKASPGQVGVLSIRGIGIQFQPDGSVSYLLTVWNVGSKSIKFDVVATQFFEGQEIPSAAPAAPPPPRPSPPLYKLARATTLGVTGPQLVGAGAQFGGSVPLHIQEVARAQGGVLTVDAATSAAGLAPIGSTLGQVTISKTTG